MVRKWFIHIEEVVFIGANCLVLRYKRKVPLFVLIAAALLQHYPSSNTTAIGASWKGDNLCFTIYLGEFWIL